MAAGVLAAGALALAFVPLFGLLGYEFATALAVPASILAAWLGARAPTWQRALAQSELMLLPPLFVITLNALRVRNCDYWGGLAFYLLGPGLSVFCGAVAGFVCARVLRRPTLCAVLVIVGSLLWGLVRFYRTPAIFGFDPFLGYFAGTLYDEEVALPPAFFYARAMHIALVAAALLLALRRRVPGLAALAAGCVLYALSGRLAIAPEASDIARALGGARTSAHFTIVYGRGSATEKEIDLLTRDHEFRYAQLARAIGVEPPGGHVVSFIFPSAAEKKKWMGAGRTFIAKPWRREIYLQHEPFPHPVLKHELAHVFAGAFGDRLFHVSMRYWPPRLNVGLIEGVAVALDWRGGRELSAAGYARALDELGLSPPLRAVFGLRFLGFSGPRAYAVAGAFCHYLLTSYGPARLRALYQSAGDFAGAYGRSLEALEQEWRAALASEKLTERERELTREAMRQPAIWHKVCAHTLAARRGEADEARGRGDFAEAEKCLERNLRDDPDEPQNLSALAELRAAAGDLERAREAIGRAQAHAKTSAALRAHLEDMLGDLAARAGQADQARAHWQAVLALPIDEGTERTARAKLALATDPRLSAPLGRFFFGDAHGRRDPALDLYFATLAAQAAPELGLPIYLVGRGLYLREAFADALGPLEQARTRPLPHAAFERELLRILALAAYRADKPERAGRAFEELARRADVPAGMLLEAQDWLDRLRWETLTKPRALGSLPPAP
ncbi:MAG TPA: hypothetical protein VKN99_25700 [Polyangia bacterium]|nr:hypothetical protein [Polyangia bacterium]